MTCIALDDEPLALEIIALFCEKIPFLTLQKTFTKPSEADKYLRKFPVDLIFLDIQMPDTDGISFYKSLKTNALLIFTTAFSQYAVDGFNLNAVDFLLKPFEFSRFKQAVEKAKEYNNFLQQQDSEEIRHLFVRSEYKLVKIAFSEILYIETLDDYIKIHQLGKKPILTLSSMKTIESKLPKKEFLRVHRSYIVPISKIASVRNKAIDLEVTEIPIGKSYEENFFKIYTRQNFL